MKDRFKVKVEPEERAASMKTISNIRNKFRELVGLVAKNKKIEDIYSQLGKVIIAGD